jgi:hypothetical protein
MSPVDQKTFFAIGYSRYYFLRVDNNSGFLKLRTGYGFAIRIIFSDPDDGFIGCLGHSRGNTFKRDPD